MEGGGVLGWVLKKTREKVEERGRGREEEKVEKSF